MLFPIVSRVLVSALLASAQFQTLEYTRSLQSKDSSTKATTSSTGTAACTIVLLSNTKGTSFDEYIRDAYLSVKRRWFAQMPASIEKGQHGMNVVEFRILKDGNLDKDSVKMIVSSAKNDFDSASLQAVREAAPFKHLPESFSEPYIALRFNFYYNLPIPGNPR